MGGAHLEQSVIPLSAEQGLAHVGAADPAHGDAQLALTGQGVEPVARQLIGQGGGETESKSFYAAVYSPQKNYIEIKVDTTGRITIILKTDIAHKAGFSTDKAKPFSSKWRRKGYSHLDYGFKIDDFRIDLEKILPVMDGDTNKQDSAERQE